MVTLDPQKLIESKIDHMNIFHMKLRYEPTLVQTMYIRFA